MIKIIFSVMAGCCLLGSLNAEASETVVFEQDFSTSPSLADYVGTGTNQFTQISSSNVAGFQWEIIDGSLQGNRTGNAGAFSKKGLDIGSGAMIEFTFNALDITAVRDSAIEVRLGSGFGATTNAAPLNAETYARFNINLLDEVTDFYSFRKLEGGRIDSAAFNGLQTILWVVNNTGKSFSYLAPDATWATVEDAAWDLWIGSSQVFSSIRALTSERAIADLKVYWGEGGEGVIQFDDFKITAIPEPSAWMLLAAGLGVAGWIWKRQNFLQPPC